MEFDIETYYLFINFKTARDSFKRENLFKAMQEIGIPRKAL